MSNTEITRLPEKGVRDLEQLHALLDSQYVGHVGLVRDGGPVVIPTGIARDGDRVLVHGSTGSGWMRQLAAGADACVTVTSLHGVVVARSTFESSFHYRSAVLYGSFTPLRDADKRRALDVVAEHFIPGRTREVRPSTEKELAATLVLAMPIARWSLKVSEQWPEDEPSDVEGDAWAGVVPLRTTFGEPQPAPDLRAGIDLPPSVRNLQMRGF
jgi:nitroimidazol reductase NimA-like FMN-containing flavoprotein (pyridoxamine 5'-phosphate oxidase superfamily)